jgi:ABC-2 type transport system permease protein
MSPLRLSWRIARRSTWIWTGVVALIVVSGATAYRQAYPSAATRVAFALSIGSSRAFDALYGRPEHVETVGGFVAWRYGAFLTTVVGLWALLTTSRMLRGDEEQQRAALLVASDVGQWSLLAAQCSALFAAITLVSLGALAGCVIGRIPLGGGSLLALEVWLSGLVFAGFAAVASQLHASRRKAAGWVGSLLGAAYLVRALGDATPKRSWIAWCSPLGWAARISPFGRHQPAAFAASASAVVLAVAATIVLRARRDTEAGVLTSIDHGRAPRTVRGPIALAARLQRGTIIGWSVGLTIGGLVLGFIAADVVDFTRKNPTIRDMLARMGGASLVTVRGFLGLSFAFIAVALSAFAAAQVIATREEEELARAEQLLAAGVSRSRWLTSRVVVATVATVAVGGLAGVGAWIGVHTSSGSVSLWDAVRGGLNTVPTALVFGGFGIAVFGRAPRATTLAGYGAVVAGYVILLIGAIAKAPSWVLDLSPFRHTGAVPAVPEPTVAVAVMIAVAGVLGALGAAAFVRRDLTGA